MSVKTASCWILFWCFPVCVWANPDVDIPKQTVRTVSSGDMLNWSVGLFVVLCIFFLCIWGMRKLNGISVNGAEKMRVVGGLSLGMREKIILLQVGKKQLILGVTPGRIDALHVLEGDDCLVKDDSRDGGGRAPKVGALGDAGAVAGESAVMESGFAQKLRQVMKGRSDA